MSKKLSQQCFFAVFFPYYFYSTHVGTSPVTFRNLPEANHCFKITPRGYQRNRFPLRFTFDVWTPIVDYCDVRAQAVPVEAGRVNVTIISSDPNVHQLTCILDGTHQPICQLSIFTKVMIMCSTVFHLLVCRLIPTAYYCVARCSPRKFVRVVTVEFIV